MPRTGNNWPLVLWLHCTDHCRSRRNRTFWHYTLAFQEPYNHRRRLLSLNNPFHNSSGFHRLFLFHKGLLNICQKRTNRPYRLNEHSHRNSCLIHTGSIRYRVLQMKMENCNIIGSVIERRSVTSRYHGSKFLDHNNRELKHRRRRRQQERQKSNRFISTKQ